MKFWIIVLVVVVAVAAWGWSVDRRRAGRGGQGSGDTEGAARRSQGHDNAGGASPGGHSAGSGF